MTVMQKRFRFTKRELAALPAPERGEYTVRDTEQGDLTCRVLANGSKTLQVFKRPKGAHSKVRIKIGSVDMNLGMARERAARIALDLRQQINPNDKAREAAAVKAAKDKAAQAAKTLTLEAVLQDYIKAHRKLAELTVDNYRNSVNNHLANWKQTELASLTRRDIERQHAKISARYPVAADKAIEHMKLLWNWQHEESQEQGMSFPVWPLRKKREKGLKNGSRPRQDYLPPGNMPDWYQAVIDLPNTNTKGNGELTRDYLLFLLYTGCRRRECTGLLADAVDLKGRILTFRETKSGAPLMLPICDPLVPILERRLALVTDGDARVFPLKEPAKSIGIVRRESGVYFTSHGLRRTFITVAESLDISLLAIRALVNHADPAKGASGVTGGYAQPSPERLRGASNKIATEIQRQAGVLQGSVVSMRAAV